MKSPKVKRETKEFSAAVGRALLAKGHRLDLGEAEARPLRIARPEGAVAFGHRGWPHQGVAGVGVQHHPTGDHGDTHHAYAGKPQSVARQALGQRGFGRGAHWSGNLGSPDYGSLTAGLWTPCGMLECVTSL